jgi:hypothetical protein
LVGEGFFLDGVGQIGQSGVSFVFLLSGEGYDVSVMGFM